MSQFTKQDFRRASEFLASLNYDVAAAHQLIEFANSFRGIIGQEPASGSTQQGAERQDAGWFYQESEHVDTQQELR